MCVYLFMYVYDNWPGLFIVTQSMKTMNENICEMHAKNVIYL